MVTQVIRLDGRSGIITGAANGLGRCYALALAARGARLVVNDIDPAASHTVDAILQSGGEAVAQVGSVADPASGDSLVNTAVEAFGSIDFVVANAGGIRRSAFEDQTDEDLEALLDVHVRAPFRLARAAYRAMKAASYGRIVLVGSNAGLFGQPNAASYATAKGAIVGLGATLAQEGGPFGVLTNVVHPLAATAISPHVTGERAVRMRPEHAASAVVYLASESCRVNQAMVLVGGGALARNIAATTMRWRPSDADLVMTPEQVRDHLPGGGDGEFTVIPASVADDVARLLPELAAS